MQTCVGVAVCNYRSELCVCVKLSKLGLVIYTTMNGGLETSDYEMLCQCRLGDVGSCCIYIGQEVEHEQL